MRFVFWDIDGTLLTTGRAGIIAWEQAIHDEYGVHTDLSRVRTAGHTDTEIAITLARQVRPDATGDEAERVLRRYEKHLPDCLPLRQGRVLPGVVAVLERLQEIREIRCLLLTGNTRAGAAAKLSHYGLDKFFGGGAFSDGCADRVEVAKRAYRLLSDEVSTGRLLSVHVVGDTPNDISCGTAIGARTIAIATGEYGLDDLKCHRPWVVLPELPDPDAFLQLVQESEQEV